MSTVGFFANLHSCRYFSFEMIFLTYNVFTNLCLVLYWSLFLFVDFSNQSINVT